MNDLLTGLARRRGAWAALLGAALVVRLAVVLTAPRVLMWPDGRYFEAIGYGLATAGTYGDQTIYAPLYPTLIAAVYEVAGRNLLVLRLVEAVLSTGTVALVGGLGGALFGPAAGLVAAALAAVHPVLVLLPVTQYAENVIAFLGALAFGSFVAAVRRPTVRGWLVSGVLFGLLMLTKPNAVAFLPGLAVGAWWQLGRQRVPRVRWAAIFCLALAVTLLPWVARNHRVHGRWYLVTTGGGRQFWMGNNPAATGASNYNPAPPTWMWDTLYARRDQIEREGVYYREGWRFVREQPGRALQLYLAKMGALWALYPNPGTHTQYSTRVADLAQGLCSAVVFAGALVGLAQVGGYGIPFLPLAVLSFTLLNSAFLMVLRYRMSFEVILLWLAGIGYATLAERFGGPARAA